VSSYHNTIEDLDHPVAWAKDHKPNGIVAVLDGKCYDRLTLPQEPDLEVVTMIEEGKVRGLGQYWEMTPVESMPQAPELLEDLPCMWYPEGYEDGCSEGEFCKAPTVAMGNGVSGPGFVAMCAEHIKDDRENSRWGFSWWYPVKVTIRQLDDLLWEGELRPGRGY
jgi:hypothetical protein